MPPKQTKGTIAACACPWCGKANDFRDMEDFGIEVGSTLECDHCNRKFQIMAVQKVTLIRLKPA